MTWIVLALLLGIAFGHAETMIRASFPSNPYKLGTQFSGRAQFHAIPTIVMALAFAAVLLNHIQAFEWSDTSTYVWSAALICVAALGQGFGKGRAERTVGIWRFHAHYQAQVTISNSRRLPWSLS